MFVTNVQFRRLALGSALLLICGTFCFCPVRSSGIGAEEPASPASNRQSSTKDGKLKELLKERLAVLREVSDQIKAGYETGRVSFDRVQQATRALLDAELELCETDKERITVLEKIIALAKQQEKTAEQRYKAGAAQTSDVLMATAGRLEIEIALVWRKDLKRDFGGRPGIWGYAESLLVDGDRVIVTPGGREAALVAPDRRDGHMIWRTSVPLGDRDYPPHQRDPYSDPGVAAYASVIVAEVDGLRQFVQFLQGGLVGIGASDGKLLWQHGSSSNSYANCPTPLYHNGYLFSASGWKGASLIELQHSDHGTTPRLIYANKNMLNQYGGIILHDGHVYGCSGGVLTCVNLLTGQVAWKDRSVGMGPLTYADGHLYVRGDGGTVALVEATPAGYREHGRFDIPDRTDRPDRAYPVVTGGRLYLRDDDLLLCYDLTEGL